MPAPIVAYWEARVAYWEAIPDDLKITIGLACLAALLVAIAIWWLWWRLPKREAARLALKIRDAKARADVEDNYRKTVGQALGGIVVLLGAGVAYLQFSQQQRAAHDLLISNQVAKGFELLGNKDKDAVVLRLGGIYALEGVMNGSEQYHKPVLEALTAFVREGAKLPTTPPTPGPPAEPPTDIQAALTVIGRRSAGQGVVNLTGAGLTRANLTRADLSGANLSGANLTGAGLYGADLTSANLTSAHLNGADLTAAHLSGAHLNGADLIGASLTSASLTSAHLNGADLTGAHLSFAHLTGADLTGASLTDAKLTDAGLTHADLTGAHLNGADLNGADLTGAHLSFAHLNGADLTGADLSGAKIDQKQLDVACGSDAKPPGLTLKPCPTVIVP
jgi:uncharacterized protein YjbI with pentapeptide repeats